MPSFFQTDPVLQDYKDCFSDKFGKLPNKVHLEVNPSVPPVVHPPFLNQQERSSQRLKKIGWDYC